MTNMIGTTRTACLKAALIACRLGSRSAMILGLLVFLTFVGCGGSPDPIVFDEISELPISEELVEIEIGSFIVPIPLVLDDSDENFEVDNRVQINFTLVGVVDPKKESKVRYLLELHDGKVRDEIMTVCRNTSHIDIVEADWSTFKAHLLDAIQPFLGGEALQKIVMPKIVKELL